MEMIWAGCPELALENLVCMFGMSQEGKCQVEITVPILSEMEQRQEGPVLCTCTPGQTEGFRPRERRKCVS